MKWNQDKKTVKVIILLKISIKISGLSQLSKLNQTLNFD